MWVTHQARESHNHQEGREREKCTFLKREKDGFLTCLELGKGGGVPTRLSNGRGKVHLEALGLWWSVGEDGEGGAFSSFHESYEEAFCETWMHKMSSFLH